jgi:adenosylcobinamide kinase/adenosylcobinamide-phosphate guanylyltransferase
LIYENIDWKPEVFKLVECIEQQKNTIILVTNELGSGILPENKLAREFSDIVGETNSIIAENVNKVYFVVSGISLKIKG